MVMKRDCRVCRLKALTRPSEWEMCKRPRQKRKAVGDGKSRKMRTDTIGFYSTSNSNLVIEAASSNVKNGARKKRAEGGGVLKKEIFSNKLQRRGERG